MAKDCKIFEAGVSRAKSAAHSGNVDRSEGWSASDDPKPDDCLAYHADAAEGDKGHQAFPVFKDGKLHRGGVIAAESRAAREGYDSIAAAAKEILGIIDKKSEASAFCFQTNASAVLDSQETEGGQPVFNYW